MNWKFESFRFMFFVKFWGRFSDLLLWDPNLEPFYLLIHFWLCFCFRHNQLHEWNAFTIFNPPKNNSIWFYDFYILYISSVCLFALLQKCDTSNHLNHSVMFFVVFFLHRMKCSGVFKPFFWKPVYKTWENQGNFVLIQYQIFGVATYIFSGMPVIYWSMNLSSLAFSTMRGVSCELYSTF